jgi:hypothetical protein
MPETLTQRHVRYLRSAELQLLLAFKVNTLTVGSIIALPICHWRYGKHALSRDELALSMTDATLAADVLQRSTTLTLAVHIKSAFTQVIGPRERLDDPAHRAAFEIARLIRNAYTHQPMDPHWSIDPPCRDQEYIVPAVIRFDTTGLDGKRFEWQDYGGPIALYRLSEYVRLQVLPHHHTVTTTKTV